MPCPEIAKKKAFPTANDTLIKSQSHGKNVLTPHLLPSHNQRYAQANVSYTNIYILPLYNIGDACVIL